MRSGSSFLRSLTFVFLKRPSLLPFLPLVGILKCSCNKTVFCFAVRLLSDKCTDCKLWASEIALPRLISIEFYGAVDGYYYYKLTII